MCVPDGGFCLSSLRRDGEERQKEEERNGTKRVSILFTLTYPGVQHALRLRKGTKSEEWEGVHLKT